MALNGLERLAGLSHSSASEGVNFIGDMQSVPIGPDDVLVLKTERSISDETAKRLKRDMEYRFPGRRVLVLSDGMELGVLSPTPSDTRLDRIEQMLATLVESLTDDEGEPEDITLDGTPAPGERDQKQSLG